MPEITAFYSALLGLLFVFLSVLTLRRRKAIKVGIGDGDDVQLKKYMRVHGNFQEYVPISLILIGFLELLANTTWLIHIAGLSLLLGRLLHAYGVSQLHEKLQYRVIGMALTFSALLMGALGILFMTLFGEKL